MYNPYVDSGSIDPYRYDLRGEPVQLFPARDLNQRAKARFEVFNLPPSDSTMGSGNFPRRHRRSRSDYRTDPAFHNPDDDYQIRLAQTVDGRRESIPSLEDVAYSKENKRFNPVVLWNTKPSHSSSIDFDIPYLDQTDFDRVSLVISLYPPGTVSLSETVRRLISKVGAIVNIDGTTIGTCTLISEDLVITARHVIEEVEISSLRVSFNIESKSGFCSVIGYFEYVVEDDSKQDYAIIKLKAPISLRNGYAHLDLDDSLPGATVLLHYPLGKNLQVSVNTFDPQTIHYSYFIRSLHDSDYGSSGGPHFDPLGRFTAIHLGSDVTTDGCNLYRYAIKLQDIVARNPNSILANPSHGTIIPKIYLEPSSGEFFIDREGVEAQKRFTSHLGNAVKKDRKINRVKSGMVAFSEENLDYLFYHYQTKFSKVYDECLYITGLHGFTKKYTMRSHIESDHVIPHHVWASTKNRTMKKVAQGRGPRPGENAMPAITIPYDIHRNLRTTGNSLGSQQFHQKLIWLCNINKVHRAFRKCIKDYSVCGMDFKDTKVRKAVITCLDLHIYMGVINRIHRQWVINRLPKN